MKFCCAELMIQVLLLLFGKVESHQLDQSHTNCSLFKLNNTYVVSAKHREDAANYINTLDELVKKFPSSAYTQRVDEYDITNAVVEDGKVAVEYRKKHNQSFVIRAFLFGVKTVQEVTKKMLQTWYDRVMSLRIPNHLYWPLSNSSKGIPHNIKPNGQGQHLDMQSDQHNKKAVSDFVEMFKEYQSKITTDDLSVLFSKLPDSLEDGDVTHILLQISLWGKNMSKNILGKIICYLLADFLQIQGLKQVEDINSMVKLHDGSQKTLLGIVLTANGQSILFRIGVLDILKNLLCVELEQDCQIIDEIGYKPADMVSQMDDSDEKNKISHWLLQKEENPNECVKKSIWPTLASWAASWFGF